MDVSLFLSEQPSWPLKLKGVGWKCWGKSAAFFSVSHSLPPTPSYFPAYCACRSIGSGQEVWQPHCPPSHAACEFHPCVNAAGSQPSTRMQQINKLQQSKQREQILERVTRHPAKSYNYPKEKKCDKLGVKWLLCQHSTKAVWSHKTLLNTVFFCKASLAEGIWHVIAVPLTCGLFPSWLPKLICEAWYFSPPA